MRLDCDTPVTVAEVTATDGTTLRYRAWRAAAPRRGVVVLLNGIMSHSGWFFPLVDALTRDGLTVVGADRRGSGLNAEQRGDAPTAKAVIDDAIAIIDAECPPDCPLYLVGWCWGSVLALNLVRPLGERLTGLIMVAPGLFPSEAVAAAAARHEAAAAADPDAADDVATIGTPIDETMFTDGPYLDGFIRTDDARLMFITPRFRGLMTKLSMGALSRLRRLPCPLLVLLAEGDLATDNAAVHGAIAALPSEQVTTRSIVSGHAMQFDAPAFVTGEILAFARRLPGTTPTA
ncbi:MAG: alpha/beta fold hydrolase [Myxococcota bacterium]